MDPQNIYVIRGADLEHLAHLMLYGEPYKISVCIDGGVKFKVNEYTWTPPLGKTLAEEQETGEGSLRRDS